MIDELVPLQFVDGQAAEQGVQHEDEADGRAEGDDLETASGRRENVVGAAGHEDVEQVAYAREQ